MDSGRWPQCPRWDGGTQACFCWFARRQREWVDAGNEWPGGEVQMFTDYLEMAQRHDCNKPINRSLI
jgi:hypothetical protein